MINYSKQNISWLDAFKVLKTLKSPYLTQGPEIKKFEEDLCKYTGAKYAVATMNATVALHLAMLAIKLNKDEEVITSPITFVASANAALYVGAKVKFADISADTACISIEEIKKSLTAQTKAIVPVHFAGQPCDMEKIFEFAKANNLFVIEDAAHAIGSQYRGFKIGGCQYSHMAIFSFHAVKNITTGEGGAITTNDKEIYERLMLLRSHGITKDPKMMKNCEGPWFHEMQDLGYNYRMTDIQATLGISQLKKIDLFSNRKREIVDKYKIDFSSLPEVSFLDEKNYSKASFHLCVIKINLKKLKINRKELFEKLQAKNISVQVHYIPVHLQPYYAEKGFKKGDYPISEQYYEECVSIPMSSSLSEKERRYFVEIFSKIILENRIKI